MLRESMKIILTTLLILSSFASYAGNGIIITIKDGEIDQSFKNELSRIVNDTYFVEIEEISKYSLLIKSLRPEKKCNFCTLVRSLEMIDGRQVYIEDNVFIRKYQMSSSIADPVNQMNIHYHTSHTRYQNQPGTFAHEEYTEGDQRVGVMVIDESLAPGELLNQFELPIPSISAGEVYRSYFGSYFAPSHGTQVSSIIFSKKNGIGFSGVCPNCNRQFIGVDLQIDEVINALLNNSFSNLLNTYASRVISLIDQINPQSTHIVNLSWGLPFIHQGIKRVIKDKSDAGVIFVAAAGNENNYEPIFPASLPFVVSVGSYDVDPLGDHQKSDFSNMGADFVAAGDSIFPLINPNSSSIVYGNLWGTSFSTPQVSGVLGLILSELVESDSVALLPSNLQQTKELALSSLKSTAVDISTTGFDQNTGYGVVNAMDAITRAISSEEVSHPGSLQTEIAIFENESENILSKFKDNLNGTATSSGSIDIGPLSYGGCNFSMPIYLP